MRKTLTTENIAIRHYEYVTSLSPGEVISGFTKRLLHNEVAEKISSQRQSQAKKEPH
jgi:hypothetical protein